MKDLLYKIGEVNDTILTSDLTPVAAIYAGNIGKEASEQLAKQFAASGELLEALKEVVRISDRNHEAWDKAKEAIKKAES